MQANIGWAMVIIIFVFTGVGLIFVFYFGMKANILVYKKYKNRFDAWWLKIKNKLTKKEYIQEDQRA